MGGRGVMRFLLLVAVVAASATVCASQLSRNHYAGVCPDVETIVRGAVAKKFQQTFITVGALVHLYFHDCFVEVRNMASWSPICARPSFGG
jgi:peroxidase